MEVTIKAKTFDSDNGIWWVEFEAIDTAGTRTGSQAIPLPDDATDDDLIEAIRAAF